MVALGGEMRQLFSFEFMWYPALFFFHRSMRRVAPHLTKDQLFEISQISRKEFGLVTLKAVA